MSSTYNPGRVAGLWYLLLIAIGPSFLIYIPDKLYVKGNAVATVTNIAAHEQLFRFGILAELAGGVILILLVLAFYVGKAEIIRESSRQKGLNCRLEEKHV